MYLESIDVVAVRFSHTDGTSGRLRVRKRERERAGRSDQFHLLAQKENDDADERNDSRLYLLVDC